MPLLKALKELPIDTTGTTRKNPISIPASLLKFKQNNTELVWNSALNQVINRVNIFLWQDNNTVIGTNTTFYIPPAFIHLN